MKRMNNLKTPQHQSSQYTTSRLLALPLEMRTMIYELALVRPGLISLIDESGILEPARKYFEILVPESWIIIYVFCQVLRVNKQVHSEALEIFYKSNNFEVTIPDFDSSTLVKLCHKTLALKQQGIQNFSITFHFVGQPNWLNLRKWVECYFKNPSLLYILPPSKTGMRQRTLMGDIIGTMFATAGLMRKASCKWIDVEAILPEYREMLKNGDERWG
jgi:hypothetical protein